MKGKAIEACLTRLFLFYSLKKKKHLISSKNYYLLLKIDRNTSISPCPPFACVTPLTWCVFALYGSGGLDWGIIHPLDSLECIQVPEMLHWIQVHGRHQRVSGIHDFFIATCQPHSL